MKLLHLCPDQKLRSPCCLDEDHRSHGATPPACRPEEKKGEPTPTRLSRAGEEGERGKMLRHGGGPVGSLARSGERGGPSWLPLQLGVAPGAFPVLRRSVIFHPAVFGYEGVDHLFHGQVGDQLVLGQRASSHGVKVANPLVGGGREKAVVRGRKGYRSQGRRSFSGQR